MSEEEIRQEFIRLTSERSLRGFWHRKEGKNLLSVLTDTPFSEFKTTVEKIWSLSNNCSSIPRCVICGSAASFYNRDYLKTCGKSCGAKLARENTPPNIKSAGLNKAVANARSDKSKQKRRQTLLNTLAENGQCINDKRRKTCIEKYGVDHPLKNKEIRDKIEQTNLKVYGTRNAASSPNVISKRLETANSKYITDILPKRVERARQENNVIPQFDLSSYHPTQLWYDWSCLKCSSNFKHTLLDGVVPSCPNCRPKSKVQQQVFDYCTSLGFTVKSNDRTIIAPRELDIVIPDKKIAIEVNGVYWHKDGGPSMPLFLKTKLAVMAGYQLLHFWDFEVLKKWQIVSSIISSKLGKINKRIGARQCSLVEIDTTTARLFLDDNHLNGYATSRKKLGLTFENELVAVATFSKPRFYKSANDSLELVRFCVRRGWHVQGALSKLVYNSKAQTILSYADRRISNGSGYLSAGFVLTGTTGPNYIYRKGPLTLTRHDTKKSLLPGLLGEAFDPLMTERQNMENAQWTRISDSGNLKFVWNKQDKDSICGG